MNNFFFVISFSLFNWLTEYQSHALNLGQHAIFWNRWLLVLKSHCLILSWSTPQLFVNWWFFRVFSWWFTVIDCGVSIALPLSVWLSHSVIHRLIFIEVFHQRYQISLTALSLFYLRMCLAWDRLMFPVFLILVTRFNVLHLFHVNAQEIFRVWGSIAGRILRFSKNLLRNRIPEIKMLRFFYHNCHSHFIFILIFN